MLSHPKLATVPGSDKVRRRMCRTLRAGMRQYGLFRYFDKVLPQVVIRSGLEL